MQYCTLSWNQKCAKHSCLSDTTIKTLNIQITINQTSNQHLQLLVLINLVGWVGWALYEIRMWAYMVSFWSKVCECCRSGSPIQRLAKKCQSIPDICNFFTQTRFLENKIYTEERVNYDKRISRQNSVNRDLLNQANNKDHSDIFCKYYTHCIKL